MTVTKTAEELVATIGPKRADENAQKKLQQVTEARETGVQFLEDVMNSLCLSLEAKHMDISGIDSAGKGSSESISVTRKAVIARDALATVCEEKTIWVRLFQHIGREGTADASYLVEAPSRMVPLQCVYLVTSQFHRNILSEAPHRRCQLGGECRVSLQIPNVIS